MRTVTLYGYFDSPRSYRDESAGSDEIFRERTDAADALLGELHELADIYGEYPGKNNLATLNRMAGVAPVALEEKLLDLLDFGVKIYELTDGEINIMMGSVLSLWHDLREEGLRLPAEEELASRAAHTDIASLVIDGAAGTAFITDPGASVDVGAIAKGYACGMTVDLLRQRGVSSFVLDAGGNLGAIGRKADGEPWNTGIRNPDLSDTAHPYAAYFLLSDGCLSTSGGYERFYTVDGANYHHLIDPDTLFPGTRPGSVSVYCSADGGASPLCGGVADALSSALFLLSDEDGLALAARAKAAFGIARMTVIYADGANASVHEIP